MWRMYISRKPAKPVWTRLRFSFWEMLLFLDLLHNKFKLPDLQISDSMLCLEEVQSRTQGKAVAMEIKIRK
jgi:hypothetical protein